MIMLTRSSERTFYPSRYTGIKIYNISIYTSDLSHNRNRDTTAKFSTTATAVTFFNNRAYFRKILFNKKFIYLVKVVVIL